MPEMNRTATRSNTEPMATRTLPPQRGLVTIRVLKSVFKSVTAFATSLAAADFGRGNRNGEEDGTSLPLSSPSTTPPIPSGYNSDA
ncbi:hypothetical protein E2542_SST10170 [Spatholobus suberectus]|nr:hypothetical protein E2542_SST10170 [Spatholobus suberectus]